MCVHSSDTSPPIHTQGGSDKATAWPRCMGNSTNTNKDERLVRPVNVNKYGSREATALHKHCCYITCWTHLLVNLHATINIPGHVDYINTKKQRKLSKCLWVKNYLSPLCCKVGLTFNTPGYHISKRASSVKDLSAFLRKLPELLSFFFWQSHVTKLIICRH